MYKSILGRPLAEKITRGAYIDDFNIGQLISRAQSLYGGEDIRALYLDVPTDKETIAYRRQVTEDLRDPAMYRGLWQYAKEMKKATGYEKECEFCSDDLQRQKYHLDAMWHFAKAVEKLLSVLESHSHTPAMEELTEYIKQYQQSESYRQWWPLAQTLHQVLDEEEVVFTVSRNRLVLAEEQEKNSLEDRFYQAFSIEKKGDAPVNRRRREVMTLLEQQLARKRVAATKSGKHLKQLEKWDMDPVLCRLAKEAALYLSYEKVVEQIQEQGYTFCVPEEGEHLEVQDGFDLGMVLMEREKKVVTNSLKMQEGERFLVVTGASGGGKTTFARMLGQVVYLSQMGLMVPAARAVVPYYSGIFSHFSREESRESGRGKLKEELERLAPEMGLSEKGRFVVLNELFTTAASYDAEIMGDRVLDHFMDRQCDGVYVTHIRNLAKERSGLVSLVAKLAGDHRTRTFEIVRKPADQGEYEDSLITKYGMIYEKMREVIEDDTVL